MGKTIAAANMKVINVGNDRSEQKLCKLQPGTSYHNFQSFLWVNQS